MKELIIITAFDGFFGQRQYRWISLDVQKIKNCFEQHGINTYITCYDDIINKRKTIKDSYIFYTSTQEPRYRQMIEDVIFSLNLKNTLLPGFDFLKAHENKGYQILLSKQLGIESLKSYYFSNLTDIENNNLEFPMVYKPVSGAGSKGVTIVNSKNDIYNLIAPKDKWYWKYPKKKKDIQKSIHYKFKYLTTRFVLQEFLPGLDSDYKVLIFGEKYYAVKRSVRHGDFRASGSGKFEYIEPSDKLLTYAKFIFEKLNTPYASLDICEYNHKFYLIEFQCLHIGPLVNLGSSGYFYFNNCWHYQEETPNLEKAYCESIVRYINK